LNTESFQGEGQKVPYPKRSHGWLAVAVLTLATVFAYIDRLILYILAEPVLQTLHMTDTQISVLQGLAFIAFYCLFGVPLGRLADRYNRRNIVVVGVAIWSAMTVLCGLATDFWTLFIARAGVGVGEACLLPAAFSLIADYFPQRLRGRAMSCIVVAMPIGSGGSFLLGGWITSMVPGIEQVDLPLIGATYGWQLAFLVAGLPGFLIALLLLTIKEPPRREQQTVEEASTQGPKKKSALRTHLKENRKVLILFIAGASAFSLTSYGTTAWMATYYIRVFEYSVEVVGYYVGIFNIIGGVLGAIVGGYLSDLCSRNANGPGRISVPFWTAFMIAPCLFVWIYADSLVISAMFLFASHFGFSLAVASFPSTLQAITPNQFRGQVMAVLFALNGIVGAGLGPMMIALATEHVFIEGGLRYSLMTLLPLTMFLAAGLILMGRRDYRAARLDIPEAPRSAESVS